MPDLHSQILKRLNEADGPLTRSALLRRLTPPTGAEVGAALQDLERQGNVRLERRATAGRALTVIHRTQQS